MRKRITALALACVMVLGTAALATGTEKTISVTPMDMSINGQTVVPTKSDGTPAEVFAYDGATYVPLRYLSELLGIEVVWDKNAPNTAKLVSDKLGTSIGFKAGEYEAVAAGRLGDVKVKVTFTDDAIASVKVVEHSETPFLSDKAIEQIPADIVRYQSLGVNTVSGATFTSRAILNAVGDTVKQAGGDAEALAKVPVSYPALETKDLEADVAVLGSGPAGLMAAYTAAETGAKVILVEKEDIVGGTLNVAAGMLLAVGTERNDPATDDSIDRVLAFYRKANSDSVHQPDYDFTAALMKKTGKTVDILIDKGLDFTPVDNGNYTGAIFTIGHKLAKDLVGFAEEEGATVLTGTKAKSLLQAADGSVTGVVVENRSGEFKITAKKVIVATGGASWSPDLRAAQPELAKVDLHEKTQIGSTADGFHMLKDIGAQMAKDLYVKSSQPDFAEVFHNDWSNTPGMGMTLLLDGEGRRFVNEGLAATVLNTKMLNHASGAYWNLIDEGNTVGFNEDYFNRIKTYAEEGNVRVAVYGKTLEELAGKLGVDPTVLKATVDSYNAACAAGKDKEFGKASDLLKAYPENSGYYAVYRRIGSWGTIGGAIVDGQQRVLDTAGQPIPNVFAAGETATAQLFGDYYFGGFSLGLYTTAGRVAAENAVAELRK